MFRWPHHASACASLKPPDGPYPQLDDEAFLAADERFAAAVTAGAGRPCAHCSPMSDFPADPLPDASLALLAQGYGFGLRRYADLGTDAFETRIMLAPATVARGSEAAAMFYRPDRFTRRGGVPKPTLWSLQDEGSVMTLEGRAHRHRKALLMELCNGAAPSDVADRFEAGWIRTLPRFRRRPRVALLYAARALLTRALTDWAGTPLAAADGPRRTHEFGAMVDGAGSVGPRNWRGLWLRRRTERWARGWIADVRSGRRHALPGSPIAAIAGHRDADGRPLDVRTAGVELINCIRPAVANDRYVVFAAHALHAFPRARPAPDDDAALERFANEVRRFYPFIPMMGGRALEAFEWRGRRFEPGEWVLFDIHGTHRDPRLWDDVDRFDPDRFRGRPPGAHDLVSHGAGDADVTHRCPGEAMTVAIIKRATKLLLATPYDLPAQDLSIPLGRIPAAPRSRFLVRFH